MISECGHSRSLHQGVVAVDRGVNASLRIVERVATLILAPNPICAAVKRTIPPKSAIHITKMMKTHETAKPQLASATMLQRLAESTIPCGMAIITCIAVRTVATDAKRNNKGAKKRSTYAPVCQYISW